MMLKCELVVNNRLAPGKDSKRTFVTFIFSKKKKGKEKEKENAGGGGDVVFFTVHTPKKKEGSVYEVKGNISQVHRKFVDQGMCTICMKEPPHNLNISKAPVDNLKKFLEILKLAFTGSDVSELVNLDNKIKLKLCDLDKPKTTMRILAKTEYPVRESFPTTLENLQISCALKKFDMRILKLSFLRVLDLSDNKLSSLCDSLDSLQTLRNINLMNNLFERMPSCICTGETAKRITLLDMTNNHIKYLPITFAHLKNVHTLKLDGNQVSFLPSTFGQLRTLKCLHLSNNELKILPWSFSLLQLDVLDLSGNCFGSGDEIKFNVQPLAPIPPLFELAARFIVKNRLKNLDVLLPRNIIQRLDSCKFCPCGTPCVTHCAPYVTHFNLSDVAHAISYDEYLMANKARLKGVGYLCSVGCYEEWKKNPNTLFTSRQRKRPYTS